MKDEYENLSKNTPKMKNLFSDLKVGKGKRKKKDIFRLSSGNVQNFYFAVLLWRCTFSTVANYYISYNLIHAIKEKNTSVLKINLMIKHKQ